MIVIKKSTLAFLYILIFFIISINLNADNQNRSLKYIKSLEYNLLCSQIYNTARHNIENLDLINAKSVMLEQTNFKDLPLAIVSDIDETILLNYEFQKMLSTTQQTFSYNLFEKFINQKTASVINGSLKYYNYLASKGIKIIYISNRRHSSEDKTYEHLLELGYPIDSKEDLLLENEKDTWLSNKSTRRAYIANKYNVIQIFGDNLLDFAKNEDLVIKNKDKFGNVWFLLPNPFYGTWLKK